jgi:hypothetical protein
MMFSNTCQGLWVYGNLVRTFAGLASTWPLCNWRQVQICPSGSFSGATMHHVFKSSGGMTGLKPLNNLTGYHTIISQAPSPCVAPKNCDDQAMESIISAGQFCGVGVCSSAKSPSNPTYSRAGICVGNWTALDCSACVISGWSCLLCS